MPVFLITKPAQSHTRVRYSTIRYNVQALPYLVRVVRNVRDMWSVPPCPRRVLAAIPAREGRGGVLAGGTPRKTMPCAPILPVAGRKVLRRACGQRRGILSVERVIELTIDAVQVEKRRLFIVGRIVCLWAERRAAIYICRQKEDCKMPQDYTEA